MCRLSPVLICFFLFHSYRFFSDAHGSSAVDGVNKESNYIWDCGSSQIQQFCLLNSNFRFILVIDNHPENGFLEGLYVRDIIHQLQDPMDENHFSEYERDSAKQFLREFENCAKVDPEGSRKILLPFVQEVLSSLFILIPKLEWRIEKGGIETLLFYFRLLKEEKFTFISPKENIDNFIAHHLGGEIVSPIRWLGTLKELANLMNCLLNKYGTGESPIPYDGYIKNIEGDINKIICQHFADKDGKPFDHNIMKTYRDEINSPIGRKAKAKVDELMRELDRKHSEVRNERDA